MKVLIIPYTFYTHFDSFELIFKELSSRKIEVKYFYIQLNDYFDELNKPYLDKIPSENLIKPRLFINKYTLNFVGRSINLLNYLINFRIIARHIKNERPKVVILGTDVGGVYIRKIQDICNSENIKVVVLQNVFFMPTNDRQELVVNYYFVVKYFLKLLGLYRVFSFSGDIPGTYLKDSHVFTLGENIKKIIISYGKDESKVHALGNPKYDYLKNYEFNRLDKLLICNYLEIPQKSRYIIYFTETIQDLYGEEYLENLNNELRKIFETLPEDVNIIIKYHPRESLRVKVKYTQTFFSRRYRFIDNIDLVKFIYYSELCLIHFSAVIIDSILLGKPVLSIKIKDRNDILNLPKQLFINDFDLLKRKILNLILYKEYQNEYVEINKNYISDNISNFREANSTKIISNKIIELARKKDG